MSAAVRAARVTPGARGWRARAGAMLRRAFDAVNGTPALHDVARADVQGLFALGRA